MPVTLKVVGVENASAEVKSAIERGEQLGMESVLVRGVQLVKEGTPVGATGNLANAITFDFQGGRSQLRGAVFAGPPADIYSAPVDLGSRPHFPPPEALLLWVQKKFNPRSEKEARSIAFLVARSISRRGTTGKFMFERAETQLEKEAQTIFENEIARSIEEAGLAPAA